MTGGVLDDDVTCGQLDCSVVPKVEHDGLFVTKFKSRMSVRSIEYMVSKYLTETGIHHASVHTLRHTMAPIMLREAQT